MGAVRDPACARGAARERMEGGVGRKKWGGEKWKRREEKRREEGVVGKGVGRGEGTRVDREEGQGGGVQVVEERAVENGKKEWVEICGGGFREDCQNPETGTKAKRGGKGEKLQRARYPAQPTGTEPTDQQTLELEHEQKGGG
jgi:hypothetical protein